ncbi:hypothetical protein [Marinospirillum alkaliphilum]|uniref:Uncharacterized protein n=1 Tax=Marinospirillum alkaliphilum DSM 21637 TaxID=1122209 RepID=A0A1K1WXH7_9GAMM|nr:hypothetical protein [Marinospirillum alkaliphilum]SFX42114.1 hypothetical protein SAMN02745752_01585 [Marinospirillum alkaliphilum DSM 21637]
MQILEFLEKTISELSAKRVAVICATLAVGIIGIVSYELATSTFRLDKYQKAADLLSSLEPLLESRNETVRSSAQEMAANVKSIMLNEPGESFGLTSDQHRIALVILMSVPWIILSFVGIIEKFKGDPDWAYGLVGCLFLAFLFGFASYYVPSDLHWFYRYVAIPFVTYAVALSLFYAVSDDDEKNNA